MTARENVDLDRIVDYRAEYTAVIEKYQITGDNLVGLCPFHRDKQSSFSADLKTGQWHCFSEDEGGNFITFWAKYHGCDTKQAYKEILEKYGVAQDKPKPKQTGGGSNAPSLAPYSVEQYSFDKRLPVDFLTETCRVSTKKERAGLTCLQMPYFSEDGQQAAVRKRYGKKEFRWQRGSAGKICLYGEWRLPEIRKVGWAILVEGESDTQSLWYMGLPAIGVAGASMFKSYQAAVIQGLKLYIHKEPDGGGETFTSKLFRGLKEGGFTGEIYLWLCDRLGTKDPSDLFIKHGKEAAAQLIREALKGAERIDLEAQLTPEAIEGAPINLRQPEGWIYSEKGISAIDQKTYTPVGVCRTPIILTQRLKSLETGDEKIEVAFKRDGQWQTAIYPRSTIFSSRSITTLADLGCTVTSENAKRVVSFLGALEAENIDLIPKNDATSTFGWQPGKRFLPGHDDGLTLDIDERQLAGNNQGALEKIVYMIASGTGKIRGNKGGGLQTIHQWRTVALATGEEPLSTETTQTGVSTRVLEIYGGPFDNEADAALMHQQSATDCGWAGPAFIEKILQMDERRIVELYEEMQGYVRTVSEGKNGSHIAGIAAVALADAFIDTWFFGGEWAVSWASAKQMASDILINQVESNATDVNENAVQFIVDWVLSNKAYFGPNTVGTCLGFTSETGNTAYIFPSMLNQALTKAGYSYRKTMKYMADQDLIGCTVRKDTRKKDYSVSKWFGNRSARFVEFYIGKLAKAEDPVDDAEELAEARAATAQPEWEQQQFTPIDGEDEELPF